VRDIHWQKEGIDANPNDIRHIYELESLEPFFRWMHSISWKEEIVGYECMKVGLIWYCLAVVRE